jgi:hypothetical protein
MVVTSQIDGEFKGAGGRSVYKLVNGQIWEQSEYLYHYYYEWRPTVVISGSDHRAMMRVAGMGRDIPVKRVR